MTKQFLKRILRLGGIDLKRYDKSVNYYMSLYEKYKEFTMIPLGVFVSNIELSSRFLGVEGDVVECGVWRGGMIAAIAELAGKDRMIHLFDSFEGLPPAKEIDGKRALQWQTDTTSPGYYNNCATDESFAIEALKKANHDNYHMYKGWFQNTLTSYKGNKISILRLDGDWYDSVKVCLEKLFPHVTEGGAIIIDDYYTWDGCAKAVHDYLSEIKSPSRVHQWNNQVAYVIKKS